MIALQRGLVSHISHPSGTITTYGLPASRDGLPTNISVAVKGTGDITILIQASINGTDFDDVVTKTAAGQFTQSVIDLVAKKVKITTTTSSPYKLATLVS